MKLNWTLSQTILRKPIGLGINLCFFLLIVFQTPLPLAEGHSEPPISGSVTDPPVPETPVDAPRAPSIPIQTSPTDQAAAFQSLDALFPVEKIEEEKPKPTAHLQVASLEEKQSKVQDKFNKIVAEKNEQIEKKIKAELDTLDKLVEEAKKLEDDILKLADDLEKNDKELKDLESQVDKLLKNGSNQEEVNSLIKIYKSLQERNDRIYNDLAKISERANSLVNEATASIITIGGLIKTLSEDKQEVWKEKLATYREFYQEIREVRDGLAQLLSDIKKGINVDRQKRFNAKFTALIHWLDKKKKKQ